MNSYQLPPKSMAKKTGGQCCSRQTRAPVRLHGLQGLKPAQPGFNGQQTLRDIPGDLIDSSYLTQVGGSRMDPPDCRGLRQIVCLQADENPGRNGQYIYLFESKRFTDTGHGFLHTIDFSACGQHHLGSQASGFHDHMAERPAAAAGIDIIRNCTCVRLPGSK